MTLHITEHEKEQQKKMAEEIGKYSFKTFLKFKSMFPCNGLLSIDVWFKHHIYRVNYSGKDVSCVLSDQPVSITYDNDGSQKFWKNWNKFKNLKAFL